MKYFDVVIVGSGPAGAAAAFKLAEKGISVAVLEKETLPRYKTCGGGFVYRGVKMLPFDIAEVAEREFYKVDLVGDNFHFVTERDQPVITMVMRDTFDNFLVKKVTEKGGVVIDDCKLTGLDLNGEFAFLSTSKEEIKTRFVIAADGALSPTAKMAGWDKETRLLIPALEYEVKVSDADFERLSQSVRFDVDAIPGGYAWSFPKKNHLSIGVASGKRTKINLKHYYQEYLTKTLKIDNIISEEQHGFQIPVSPRTDGFVKNSVFLVGDAAGFADSVTAEGISNSIYSGMLVADAIAESNLDVKKAEEIYMSKLEERLLPEIKVGVLMAKFFYDQPKIRNLFMKKYGQGAFEAMTDVFMGKRSYPTDIMKTLKRRVKGMLFS
ncbi:NAD(P)/FAD-dependent oxidoreductase [Flavobacterium alkalisoli]|uniref:NAD(P)/FAD-dependent oxidoreductase n=1 Tax=Flavobacterium alkalisoli TaxID=2602769 RepID=A0A5B9FMD3_9FLAO|nr:NAD(P)/FAD-dependent oxidoreductase [Flavobacterium alkalisoli]QEE48030.1 NAD(P)/FAD-dependent oxidoreductase [Flavobacterium alkalisoli]